MVDEMKIHTGFMKKIIGHVVSKMIKKNLGSDIEIGFNDISMEHSENDKIKVHIDVCAEMTEDELKGLIEKQL